MCVSMGYYVDCGMSRPVADTIHHMLRYKMSLWSVSGCATAGGSQACGPRAPQNPTHATHSLQFTMVRASWTAIACPRARARDERVACSDSRIGWGGCGCKSCPSVTESCYTHSHCYIRNRLGRVWLKRVSGYCAVVSFTRSLLDTYGIDSKIGGSVVSVWVDRFLGTCTTVCEQFTKYATTIHGH